MTAAEPKDGAEDPVREADGASSSSESKAQARLNALDSVPAPADTVEKKAGFFGPNPLKKDKVEMRTSDDAVVPLPAEGAGD